MTHKKSKWAIVSYHASGQPGRDYIQSAIGVAYRELKHIAASMSRNGEGQRYAVREYFEAGDRAAPDTR